MNEPSGVVNFPLLNLLREFQLKCRQEPALTAKGKKWDQATFDAALQRLNYQEVFSLVHNSPKIEDPDQRKALHKFGLEMVEEFSKGSKHNSLVALFSAMMLWQNLDTRFQGF